MLIFIPFQAIKIAFADSFGMNGGSIFWLVHWYEPVLLILILLFIIEAVSSRRKLINNINILALLLVIIGLISVLFFSPGLDRGIEGFRFDLFAVVIFIFVSFFTFDLKEKSLLINIYLYVSLFLAVWAIFERFLPADYWRVFGLANFGFGQFKIVNFLQSSSFAAGPNQLGSYLLPAFFICIKKAGISKSEFPCLAGRQVISNKIPNPKNKMTKLGIRHWDLFRSIRSIRSIRNYPFILYSLFSILLFLAIILTFSRAALLGLVFGLIIYGLFFIKNKSVKIISGVVPIILILVGLIFYYQGGREIKDLFTHGSSQIEHFSSIKNSLFEIKNRLISEPLKFFFGSGLGTAGPAVLKYGNGFISESWYLQIALEMGIIGLLLWLYLIFDILKKLIKIKETALVLGLIAVSICALFLHTWADNPAVAVTIFVLIGTKIVTNPKS